jgi:hypothetical protein
LTCIEEDILIFQYSPGTAYVNRFLVEYKPPSTPYTSTQPTSTMPAAAPRPPKPSKARYFKGKGPEIRDSDSDSENEAPEPVVVKKDENYVAGGAGRLITNKDVQKGLKGGVKMSLADVQIGGPKKEEESEEESEEEEEEVKPKARLIQPPGDEVSSFLRIRYGR